MFAPLFYRLLPIFTVFLTLLHLHLLSTFTSLTTAKPNTVVRTTTTKTPTHTIIKTITETPAPGSNAPLHNVKLVSDMPHTTCPDCARTDPATTSTLDAIRALNQGVDALQRKAAGQNLYTASQGMFTFLFSFLNFFIQVALNTLLSVCNLCLVI